MAEAELEGVLVKIKQAEEECNKLEFGSNAWVAASQYLTVLMEEKNLLRQQGSSMDHQRALSFTIPVILRLFAYDDGNATATSVPGFKASLLAAYSAYRDDCAGRRLALCMLTYKYLPTSTVIAAHLWKRSWAHYCDLIGMDDINDIRNGLLLFKPIEWAFDNSKLSIVPDMTFNPPTFQAYLQDESLRDVLLVDKLVELQGQRRFQVTHAELEYARQELGGMTFGDVHQRNLQSTGPQSPNPFTRVLDFQYRVAQHKAQENNWRQPEGPPPPSHASPGDWHVQRMFDSMQAADSQ